MIFTYKPINHPLDALHMHIGHLVKHVWCGKKATFSPVLLNKEFRTVVEEIDNNRHAGTPLLIDAIVDIHKRVQGLRPAHRVKLAKWFDANNKVEHLCKGGSPKPGRYEDVASLDPGLVAPLKSFFNGLFLRVIITAAVTSRWHDLGHHYKAIVTKNTKDKCPFCGLGPIKGVNRTARDAYDHYLPKDKYPFNSVNLKQLAPMCHDCNSVCKGAKDPLVPDKNAKDPLSSSGKRRRAYYPYARQHSRPKFTVTLKHKDFPNLLPSDMDIVITAKNAQDKVETWKDLFNLDERYRDILCGENEGKVWASRIVMAKRFDPTDSPKKALARNLRAARAYPLNDAGFLQVAFLEECQRIGAFR
jgi:hypothetical protein